MVESVDQQVRWLPGLIRGELIGAHDGSGKTSRRFGRGSSLSHVHPMFIPRLFAITNKQRNNNFSNDQNECRERFCVAGQ